MEELEAPDGSVRSFGPKLAAYYKARGWSPVKPKGKKSTARKAAAGSVNADTATDTTEN